MDQEGGELSSPELLAAAATMLRSGRDARRVLRDEAGDVVLEAFVPPTRMVIVGAGSPGPAITDQARLLGWDTITAEDAVAASREIAALGPSDAVIVMSHDGAVDVPSLAAALEGSGYIGALGSRHTQGRRRDSLLATGVTPEQLSRIHGPVGLDIGAASPEETALAICAEIVSWRSGRDARSLSAGTGPIHL